MKRPKKILPNDILWRCDDCIKEHGGFRGAYHGAICPMHGKPLRSGGTVQQVLNKAMNP